MKMNIEGKRERGRPKNKWLNTIESHMKAVDVCLKDLEN
jgi:hypothetical protein